VFVNKPPGVFEQAALEYLKKLHRVFEQASRERSNKQLGVLEKAAREAFMKAPRELATNIFVEVKLCWKFIKHMRSNLSHNIYIYIYE